MRHLLITIAFLALLACPARGATVELTTSVSTGAHGSADESAWVQVTDGADERNVLTLTPETPAPPAYSPTALVVHDAGGTPLTVGQGCVALAPDTARCPIPSGMNSGTFATVDAGAGDDTVTLLAGHLHFTVHGGDGTDTIDGTDASDALRADGGAGDDALTGGHGSDTLLGGAGHDRIAGGDGRDEVSFQDHTEPVVAALGGDLPGGEDEIAGDVELLTGGSGADRLTGSDGPDLIQGGPGADLIVGRGGDDTLYAGTYGAQETAGDVLIGDDGNDILTLGTTGSADGGAGDDVLSASGAVTLTGGPGRDRLGLSAPLGGPGVRPPDGAAAHLVADDDGASPDLVGCGLAAVPTQVALGPTDVSTGCSSRAIHRSGPLPGALAISEADAGNNHDEHTTWLDLTCADDAPARRGCAIRVTVLDEHGHPAGRARRTLKSGTTAELRITFTRAVAKRLRAARTLPMTYLASMRDARGKVRTTRLASCVQSVDVWTSEPQPCG